MPCLPEVRLNCNNRMYPALVFRLPFMTARLTELCVDVLLLPSEVHNNLFGVKVISHHR